LFYIVLYTADDAVMRLVQTLLYKTEGRGLDSWRYTWNTFHSHNRVFDWASKRNEYKEWFPRRNATGAKGCHHYHLNWSTILKSGSLIILEISGPVRAFTGIVLPFNYKQSDDLNLCMTYC